ncbi:MAG: hypothetical protein HY907_05210 [Deltaproteobacteria bacterium]|nr:hypothetical protein [Deltaproteobacteria bacterium]
METSRLRIRTVRRYRKARYPSRSPAAKPKRSVGSTALRAAAVPAAALALGAGGCVETTVEAGADGGEDVSTRVDDAREDTGGGRDDAGGGWDDAWVTDGVGADVSHLVRLTESEGRAVIRQAVEEATRDDADPCAVPTLTERLNEDQTIEVAGSDGAVVGTADMDFLAPQDLIREGEACPQRLRQAVGFEFLTFEEGDHEEESGLATGFTAAELAALADLRSSGKAAMEVLDAELFTFWTYTYGDPSAYRAEAEANLRQAVLELIADLRRDGML